MRPTVSIASNQAMSGNYGTVITDWDSGSTFSTANSGAINTDEINPDDGVKSAYLPYNASGSSVDATLDVPYAFVNLNSIAFWAYKPEGQEARTVIAILSNTTGFTNFYRIDALIDKDGWNVYTTVLNQLSGNDEMPRVQGAITFASDTVQRIRFLASDDVANNGYSGIISGESLRIGNIYFNYRSRPMFMIDIDDNPEVLYGSDFTGKTIYSILNERGFNGTVYTITDKSDTPTYETWDNLKILQDKGWSIANHAMSYSSSQNFVDTASTSQDVIDEVDGARLALEVRGFTGGRHHALPQGKYDVKTWTAFDSLGMKSVRGVCRGCLPSPLLRNVGTNDHNIDNNVMFHPDHFNIPASYQWDNDTDITSELEDYVDFIIAHGGTGSAYGHGLTAQIILNLEALCDRLLLRQKQGLIDIVTVEEWYEAFNN